MEFSPPFSTFLHMEMTFSLGRSSSGNHLTSHSLAWYWSTFLMRSRRQKSSSASLTKRTFPVSGDFLLEVLTFSEAWGWEVGDAHDGVLRNRMCEACFAIWMSVKGEIQEDWSGNAPWWNLNIRFKICPKLSLVFLWFGLFFLDLCFSVHVCLMSELAHFCQPGAVQEYRQRQRTGMICRQTSRLN